MIVDGGWVGSAAGKGSIRLSKKRNIYGQQFIEWAQGGKQTVKLIPFYGKSTPIRCPTVCLKDDYVAPIMNELRRFRSLTSTE
jgi:hypothetical protein